MSEQCPVAGDIISSPDVCIYFCDKMADFKYVCFDIFTVKQPIKFTLVLDMCLFSMYIPTNIIDQNVVTSIATFARDMVLHLWFVHIQGNFELDTRKSSKCSNAYAPGLSHSLVCEGQLEGN